MCEGQSYIQTTVYVDVELKARIVCISHSVGLLLFHHP